MSDDFDKDGLDWLRGDDPSDDSSATGSPGDDLTFDWQQTKKDAPGAGSGTPRLGVTGQLTWLQPSTPDAGGSADSPGEGVFDWQAPTSASDPEQPSLGVTGTLSWKQADQQAQSFEQQLDDVIGDEDIAMPPSRGLRGLMSDPPAADLPDVVEDSFAEAEEMDDAGFSDLPPWMQGLDGDDADDDFEDADADAPAGAQAEEVPSWMSGALFDDDDDADDDFDDADADAPAGAQAEEVPSWMSGALFDDDDADDDFEDEDADAPAGAQAEEVPSWMSGALFDDDDADEDFEDADADAPAGAQAEEVPSWMSGALFDDDDAGDDFEDADADTPAEVQEEIQDAPIASAAWDAMPDWMRAMPIAGMDEDDADDTDDADLPEFEEAVPDAPASAMPDWLSGMTFDTPQAEEDAEAEDDDLFAEFAPLDEVFDEVTFDDPFAEDDDDADDDIDAVPDWLQSAAPAAAATPVPARVGEPDFDLGALFADVDHDEDDPEDDFAALFEEPDFDLVMDDGDEPAPDEAVPVAAAADDPFGSIFDSLGADEPEPLALDEPDFAALFGDLDDDEDIAQDAPAPAAVRTFSLAADADEDSGDVDIDALLGTTSPPAQAEAAPDDFLSWFESQQQPSVRGETPRTEDLAWLDEMGMDDLAEIEADFDAVADVDDDFLMADADDDFLAAFDLDDDDLDSPQAAPISPSYQDVDDFLASLESGEIPSVEISEPALSDDFTLDEYFSDYDSKPASQPGRPLPMGADTPDWLAGLSVSVGESLSAAAIVRQQKDRPLDELPERLRMLHERGLDLPAASEAQIVSAVTPVLPSSDLLPTVRMDALAMPGAPVLTPGQQANAALLATLVGSRASAGFAEEAAPTRTRLPLERIAIGVVLLLAVVLPFFVEALRVGDLPPAQFGADSGQQAFYDAVSRLAPGSRVLVAAEYAPTGAGELDALTEVILRHVLVRGAVPVIVGGSPTGLLHAGSIADDIAGDTFVRGTDYVVGRYLIGEAVGLRTFAANVAAYTDTDIQGQPTGLEIDGLGDFDALILIAERGESARAWLEQIVPLTDAPLLVATGASAAPLIAPYLADGAPLLVGVQDAYTYRTVLLATFGGLRLDTPTTPPVETTPEVTPEQTPAATAEASAEPSAEATAQTTPDATAEAAETDEPTETRPPTETPTAVPTATFTPAPTDPPTATATPLASPTPTPQPEVFGVVTSNQRINIRSGPSTSETPVGSLASGARVLVIGQNPDGTWYQIRTEDGVEGWVTAGLVRLETETAPATPASKRPARTVPRQQADLTPEATPQPDLTPEATALVLGEIAPVPQIDTAAALLEGGEAAYLDERWYAMTLGVLASVGVIVVGTLASLVAAVRRRAARRQG